MATTIDYNHRLRPARSTIEFQQIEGGVPLRAGVLHPHLSSVVPEWLIVFMASQEFHESGKHDSVCSDRGASL